MFESSASEILSVVVPSVFIVFIPSTLSTIYYGDKQYLWILLEFIIIVIPHILHITLLVPYMKEVICIWFFLSLLVIILLTINEPKFYEKKLLDSSIPFITNLRSAINLITVIAILAVDFKLFPKRFQKKLKYGYSLMDIGVGLFVYANGIVAPEIKGYKNSVKKTFIDAIPLIVLGLGRYVSTTLTDYSVAVTEYGKHWNFFITLAVTRILGSLILNLITPKLSMITGIFILLLHEYLLQMGVADYVFSNAPRDNLFSANREGIVSSLGFVAIYFLSLSIGVLLNLKEKEIQSKLTLILKLLISCAILFPVTFYLEYHFFMSRRLANSAYCLWVVSVGVLMTTLFCISELIQKFFYDKFGYNKQAHVPLIFNAINYNGLLFFLIANVLTGLVNMTFTTVSINTIDSFIILIIYMLLNCIIALILLKYKINLKFIIYKISRKQNLQNKHNV